MVGEMRYCNTFSQVNHFDNGDGDRNLYSSGAACSFQFFHEQKERQPRTAIKKCAAWGSNLLETSRPARQWGCFYITTPEHINRDQPKRQSTDGSLQSLIIPIYPKLGPSALHLFAPIRSHLRRHPFPGQ